MGPDTPACEPAAPRPRLPLDLRFAGLLGWTIPLGLLVGLLGIYPSYRWAGGDGVLALMAAGVIAELVVVFSAMLVCYFAWRGPAAAATVFVMSSLVRMVVCMGLAGGAWHVFALPPRVLFVWSGVFYALMVLCEAGWIARALARDATRTHLGEIDRAPVFGAPRPRAVRHGATTLP